jgi:multiple sugar transport system permease protein
MSKSYNVSNQKRKYFYYFLSLWIIGFFVFQLFPIIWGLKVSLTNQMAFSVRVKFVGLRNYLKLLSDMNFWYAIYATFKYSILNSIITVFWGLVLALILEKKIRGKNFFQVVFFLPYVMPVVAVGWIFRVFLDKNIGSMNGILEYFNLSKDGVYWLGTFPLLSILSTNLWRVGWSLLIFIGGLSTVPKDLYDAAKIDGCGRFNTIRVITLPFLSPFITFQLIISFIYGFQEFILPFLLNPLPLRGVNVTGQGGQLPPDIYFILLRGYNTVFDQGRVASGFAELWVTFILILVFSLFFIKLLKKSTYIEIES